MANTKQISINQIVDTLLFISLEMSDIGGLFRISTRATIYWSTAKLLSVFSWAI